MTRQPRNQWKLVIRTDGGPLEVKTRSQPAVYREVQKVRTQVAAGISRATGLAVCKWEREHGQWTLFENLPVREEEARHMKPDATAFLLYGVEVPRGEEGVVKRRLGTVCREDDLSVYSLHAGPPDRVKLFLATRTFDAGLHQPVSVDFREFGTSTLLEWSRQLETALKTLGVTSAKRPGWLLVATEVNPA